MAIPWKQGAMAIPWKQLYPGNRGQAVLPAGSCSWVVKVLCPAVVSSGCLRAYTAEVLIRFSYLHFEMARMEITHDW